jgi:electron transfer flavoprotein alpha subunit
MVAVVPVRAGLLPAGAAEAVAEAGGVALVIGEGTATAAAALRGTTWPVRCAEVGPYAPARWAGALAPLLAGTSVVVLPASPDGRDLAPRLAVALGRPLLAGAVIVTTDQVTLARQGGLVTQDVVVDGPVVTTLQPGVRGVAPGGAEPEVVALVLALHPVPGDDPEVLEVLDPDPATVELAEARFIVAGGAGLGGPDAFELLQTVSVALGASPGASRVASDLGWAPPDRFIGTTGVTVDPRLYVALGISGAVQHVSGLGEPDHVVAVNLDASAPMMAMADLAIVTDARALLTELALRLGVPIGESQADPAGLEAGPLASPVARPGTPADWRDPATVMTGSATDAHPGAEQA